MNNTKLHMEDLLLGVLVRLKGAAHEYKICKVDYEYIQIRRTGGSGILGFYLPKFLNLAEKVI